MTAPAPDFDAAVEARAKQLLAERDRQREVDTCAQGGHRPANHVLAGMPPSVVRSYCECATNTYELVTR